MNPDRGVARELRWAVRRSFREYVETVEDGLVQLTDVRDSDDGFVFAEAEPCGIPDVLAFAGTVEFEAYRGFLSVRISDPWIHLQEHEAQLSIAGEEESARVVIARILEIERGEGGFTAVPQLTSDGVRLLGGVYSIGDRLDPVAVVALKGE